MGSTISQTIVTEELEKMTGWGISDEIGRSSTNLNLLKNTTLDIAITGVSGAGKSSLVNALRGIKDCEEGAAETDINEATMMAKGYPHPISPNVTIWDLPGIGTPHFKPQEYLWKVNFEKYDFFIILASNRFTEHDVFLAHEIHKMKKKFYYVRTKVDLSIDSERRKRYFNEERTLGKIREYCLDNLEKAGEFFPMVFLISNWDLNKYDFPLLQATLEKDLDELKKYALITTMPNISRKVLKRKKEAMEDLILRMSLVSGAIGTIPVLGLSAVCDLGILVVTMIDFCKAFGLDEDSLQRLSRRVGKPVPVLRSAIKKSGVTDKITPAFVMNLLKKSAVCRTMTAAEVFFNFVPVLGSVFGVIGSFGTTYYMLKTFLDNVEEDAANVLALAAERYEFPEFGPTAGAILSQDLQLLDWWGAPDPGEVLPSPYDASPSFAHSDHLASAGPTSTATLHSPGEAVPGCGPGLQSLPPHEGRHSLPGLSPTKPPRRARSQRRARRSGAGDTSAMVLDLPGEEAGSCGPSSGDSGQQCRSGTPRPLPSVGGRDLEGQASHCLSESRGGLSQAGAPGDWLAGGKGSQGGGFKGGRHGKKSGMRRGERC